MKRKIILASASPRRKDLLQQIVSDFEVEASDFNEDDIHLEIFRLPYELSRLKAYSVFVKHPHDIIIASDTIVVYNHEVFGKPKTHDEAVLMLKKLSGNAHSVLTSYTIISKEKEISKTVKTRVFFRKLSDEEIVDYVNSGAPFDKSGGYAIQDPVLKPAERIIGNIETVVGFPIKELEIDLKKFLD